MTVACKISSSQCPYNDRGFCSKQTLGIDASGMCTVLWRKGQQRRVYFQKEMLDPQYNLIIEDGAVTEVTDAYESEYEEEEGSSNVAIDQAAAQVEKSQTAENKEIEQEK